MSTLKTGALRGTSGTADSVQLHASNQSVTFPGAVTVTGALTSSTTAIGGGNLKLDTIQTKDCFSGQANHDDQHIVFTVADGCVEWCLNLKMLSTTSNGRIELTLGHSNITYSDSYLGNLTWNQSNNSQGGWDLDATYAQLNKDWHDNGNKWCGTVRGSRSSATAGGSYHIWQIETMITSKDSGGMVWSSYSSQLSNADNRLTAIRLSSEAADGFDNGTVRYTGTLVV